MDETQNKRPSIRDLQIDRPTRNGPDDAPRRMQEESTPPPVAREPRRTAPRERGPRRGFRWGWWILAVVLLVAASVISLPIVFSDTTINIKPVTTKAIFTDALFTAVKQSDVAEDTEMSGMLRYSEVVWDVTQSEILEPTGREEVSEKATGIITVYNEHTTSQQRLIKNTRFETSDGHVYRVRESIMVPGKTGTTPGTLDVRVYADEAGEDYNKESGANLTLPGLKSLPDMYTNIYAKIKTPLTGGYEGERAVVEEESKIAASAALRTAIEAQIASEVESRIPEDTEYFPSGVFIEFADTATSEVDSKVQVTEMATVRVLAFNTRELAEALAFGVAGNPSKGYPVVSDMNKIRIAIDTQIPEESEEQSIKLLVNGDADFVWHFDEDDLTRDLAGKDREALTTVLAGYPTIETAEAIIRPFWRSTFPKNAHDFTIKMIDVE